MTFTPPTPGAGTPTKPKWLTLSAVAVIVVAAFGILAGLSAPLGVFMSRHHPFSSMSSSTPEMARMVALQQKLMESPVGEISIVAGLASLLAGGWALYCAARWLSEKPGAREPFRKAIVPLIATECVSGVVGFWLQMRNVEFLREYTAMFTSTPGMPRGFGTMMTTVMQGSVVVGLLVGAAWGIAKMVALVWAHRYAGKPEVVAHFERRV
jgi:hypothetical protein